MMSLKHREDEVFQTAENLIDIAFEGMVDKAGEPYVKHCRRVAELVAYRGGSLLLQTAALLHDVLEDTEWTVERLAALFPNYVVDLVVTLTKRSGEGYFEYIERLKDDTDAVLIKLADLEHNMDMSRFADVPMEMQNADWMKTRTKKYSQAHAILKVWWEQVGRFQELSGKVKMYASGDEDTLKVKFSNAVWNGVSFNIYKPFLDKHI